MIDLLAQSPGAGRRTKGGRLLFLVPVGAFLALSTEGIVPIHGLNYRDRSEDAAKWLNELGDPYTRTGADRNGRVAIDWGVYGVPETFVVRPDGRIAYKHVGPVTEEALTKMILPLVERLRRGDSGAASEPVQ